MGPHLMADRELDPVLDPGDLLGVGAGRRRVVRPRVAVVRLDLVLDDREVGDLRGPSGAAGGRGGYGGASDGQGRSGDHADADHAGPPTQALTDVSHGSSSSLR